VQSRSTIINGSSAMKRPLILTPHAGELARLYAAFDCSTPQELAHTLGAVIVAKGPTTLITNGTQQTELSEATPALATAGTGDVLAGIIGGLIAQGIAAYEGSVAAVRIHSAAGRIAEQRYGTRSVIAEDVRDAIPQALASWEQ
jgi:NAD(P)H-hydrate repair Nnr-like enzyme with NAD(P)H-hydrate dehydratase domain